VRWKGLINTLTGSV